MTRFTDGKNTLEITMHEWDSEQSQYRPSFEPDFFSVGSLPYDEERNVYTVPDVDYLADMANDWKDCKGDFSGDTVPENIERVVDIFIVTD